MFAKHFIIIKFHRLMCVLVTQSCLTLCNPMDYSSPGSSVHGILQVRILKWIATPFSRGSSLTQGLNSGLPHCRQILDHLSHQGRGGWESAGWHCLGTPSEPWFLSCVPQPTSAVWCQALHCWLTPIAQLPLATFIKDVSPGVPSERGHIAKGGLSSRILTLTKGFKFGF